jgi:hypothetical protein
MARVSPGIRPLSGDVSWGHGDDHCLRQRDYTATGLSVEEGETVTVESEESEWGWVSNESGWVPLEYLTCVR